MRKHPFVVLCVVPVALLVGCSVESVPPAETPGSTRPTAPNVGPPYRTTHAEVLKLLRSATSAATEGIITQGAERVRIVMSGPRDGTSVLLTVTDAQGPLTTLKVGTSYWVKADQAYWKKAVGDGAERLKGKWVALSPPPAAGVPTVASLLADTLELAYTPHELEGMTSERGTHRGKAVIIYSTKDGHRRITLPAAGAPWPVRYQEFDPTAKVTGPPAVSPSTGTDTSVPPGLVTDLTWGSWSSVKTLKEPDKSDVATKPT